MSIRSRAKVDPDTALRLITTQGVQRVRRASMFMAHALSASAQAETTDVNLAGFIQLVNVPQQLDPAQEDAFKAQFRDWIISNGFRELLAGMEDFLNNLYVITTEGEKASGHIHHKKARILRDSFERKGIAGKLHILKSRYGFDTGFSPYFTSLTAARNCYTHRQGVVGEKDLGAEGTLDLSWLGVDAKIIEADGTEHEITLDTKGPIDGREFDQSDNPQLTVTFVERELRFAHGDHIQIPARSVQEICTMTEYASLKLNQLTINWLLDHGIHVNGGEKAPDPTGTISVLCEEAQ